MIAHPHDDEVVRYLLHDLDEPAARALELRLLEDREVQELVAAVETDLIDDYVAGRLAPELRGRFERYYLASPNAQHRIELARQLRGALRDPAKTAKTIETANQTAHLRRRMPPRSVLIGIAAALVVIASVPVWRAGHLSGDAVVLRSGASRSADPAQLVTVAKTGHVRLQLELPTTTGIDFRAAMLTPEGAEVWRADALRATRGAGRTFLDVDADLHGIVRGDYVIRASVRGADGTWEGAADYAFRLEQPGPNDRR